LLPFIDKTPDQDFYQVPAADHKQVWSWYMADAIAHPEMFMACKYPYL